ncbi:MAG: SBBP repeat-containing protein, partial [Ignavibacteria bacterium]|nr:SBBP repeat-containing protein [Ignavibacteria bacterium]
MNKYYKKIQYLIIIIMFSFLLINISESQVSENWIHRYTGPLASSDSPSKFVIDSSGNMYVTGKTLIGGGFYHIV